MGADASSEKQRRPEPAPRALPDLSARPQERVADPDPLTDLHAHFGNAAIAQATTVTGGQPSAAAVKGLQSTDGNAHVAQALIRDSRIPAATATLAPSDAEASSAAQLEAADGAAQTGETLTTAAPPPDDSANAIATHQRLPAALQTGLERLSGLDLSGIRVHHNSSQPTQLDASAYTRGQDIHVASGQDKHLPHEGWHAVQQLQGRVRPTAQTKGVSINDDSALEREADVMGAKALRVAEADLSAARINASMQSNAGMTTVQRWPGNPDEETVEVRARSYLRARALSAVTGEAQSAGHVANVEAAMVSAVETGHDNEPSLDEVDAMKTRAESLHTITGTIGDDTLDLVTAIDYLQGVLGFPPELEWGNVSYGAAYFMRHVANGIADYVQGLAMGRLFPSNFQVLIGSWGDPRAFLTYELEGALAHLIALRDSFNDRQATQDERAAIGPQIGEVSRRILLLDNALVGLDADPDLENTPLDEALVNASGKIDAIRQAAASEEETLEALGNEPRLLRTRRIAQRDDIALGDVDAQSISPDMAFPRVSTRVTEDAVSQLASHVRGEASQVTEARSQVIPTSPTYSLPEFMKVYNYWFDFFSVSGREADEQWQAADEAYRGFHQVAGMADEGAILHTMLMDQWAPLIASHLGQAQSDFSGEIPTALRQQNVAGTAERPDYDYAELYPGTSGSSDVAGEQSSRQQVLAGEQDRTRQESGGSDNGWSYLITTEPEMGGGVQEPKVLQPEVANYLLARTQQLATLERAHTPGFGDQPMAANGVESGMGTGEQTYLEGERGAVNSSVVRNQRTIHQSQTQAKQYHDEFVGGFHRETNRSARVTKGLIGELETYLNSYFQEREDIGFRVAAILHIANKEHGAGAQFLQQLSPVELGKSILIAFGVQAFQKAIAKIASRAVARAISRGISRVMTLIGGSDISAMVFLVKWLYRAADVNGFHAARVTGYFGQYAAKALGELLSGAATGVAMKGFGSLARMRGAPRTARELTNDLSPVLNDPAARELVLQEVRAEIAQVEATLLPGERNADSDALRAIESDLVRESRSDVPDAADVRLESLPERTQQLRDDLSQIDPADMDAATRDRLLETLRDSKTPEHLREGGREGLPSQEVADGGLMLAMPPDLHGVLATRSGRPGRGVRVRYRTRTVLGLRVIDSIHVEADMQATATDINLHTGTVRRMKRLQGFSGAVHAIWRRLNAVWGNLPAEAKEPGSLGFEARQELLKLPDIIEHRMAEVAASRGDPSVRADAEAEIQSLMHQLSRHQEVVQDLEVQSREGRGYVAAESGLTSRDTEAMNAGYPDPRTAAPHHHYYSPRPGVYELRISASAPKLTNGSPTPRYRIDHTAGRRSVVQRPDGSRARSWTDRRAAFVGQHSAPRADAQHVESVLAELQAAGGWTAADAALARRWGGALQALHAQVGGRRPNLVSDLVGRLGRDASSTKYDAFRRAIRAEMVQQIMRTPSGRMRPPKDQVKVLTDFQALGDMDPASMGRLFTEYRRARFEVTTGSSAIRHVDDLPDVSTRLPDNRMADSAVHINEAGRAANAPPKGNYLVDDKSGTGSFDFAQAQRYSRVLHDNKGAMAGPDGQPVLGPNGEPVRGLVFFFESATAATIARRQSRGLHVNIHFGYFDSQGALQWAP